MKKRENVRLLEYGDSHRLVSAVGIVLGALLQNVVLWLCIGAVWA
jgi:hypothetical protein